MRTLNHPLAIVFIMALSSAMATAAPAPAPQPPDTSAAAPAAAAVTPPVPRHKPDPKDDAYVAPKPATDTVAAASIPAASPVVVPAKVAAPKLKLPFPRAKPLIQLAALRPAGPFPRAKPMPVTAPAAVPLPAPAPLASATSAPPPAATPAAAAAATPAASAAGGACGDACNEVLFRMLGDCLWVQNANPRPVAFAAKLAGGTISLALSGANAAKADAHKPFEPKEGYASPIGEGAYHTRISDPFSPSAPGIAVYRARLGTATGCVKDRKEVTSFSASFTSPPPSPRVSN